VTLDLGAKYQQISNYSFHLPSFDQTLQALLRCTGAAVLCCPALELGLPGAAATKLGWWAEWICCRETTAALLRML